MGESFLAEVGRRIQDKRKAQRLSQEELAERSELSKQTVSRAENGQRDLGSSNLAKIAQALGVSTDYLLTGKYTDVDVLLLNQSADHLTAGQFGYLEKIVKTFIEMCDEGVVK